MSFPARHHSSAPKRPKLSLQIKTPAAPQTLGKSATALKSDINPSSPTAFNTISNAYATAIENASPQILRPTVYGAQSSLNTKSRPTPSRLQTSVNAGDEYVHPSQRTQTPGPFSIAYPETPSSAHPESGSITTFPSTAIGTPSFTFTPPQSAGASDNNKMFNFASQVSASSSPRTARRKMNSTLAPYTHPKSLHSILRNSPLPPPSSIMSSTPTTSSRLALKLVTRRAKKVGYNDPLTQTITTNKYIKSHIDLLAEDSPHSATEQEFAVLDALDTTMQYTGDETKDGGQTPGPFEEMRRRMAESGLETKEGRRRAKKKDKKRKWRWTIGEGGEEEEDEDMRTPMTAVMRSPITSIWQGDGMSPVRNKQADADVDVEMGGAGVEEFSEQSGCDSLQDSSPHNLGSSPITDASVDAMDKHERRGNSVDLTIFDSETDGDSVGRPGSSQSL